MVVKDDKIKSGQRKMGQVKEVIMGRDGELHVVEVCITTRGKPQHMKRTLQILLPFKVKARRQE